MSYNLRLWTKNQIKDCSIPSLKENIVNVDKNITAEPEDMPAEVFLSIPGIKFLTDINIEPTPTDNAYIEKVNRYAKKLARENMGVLEDPQAGFVYTPSGVKTASLPPIFKDEPTISLSWYMDSKFPLKDKLSDFVDLLKEYMPNALPRRYGEYEPPKYKLQETGIEHLKEFLQKEKSPVWYAAKPVTYLFISEAYGEERHRLGYRCNRIELLILISYYNMENWNRTAKKLFKKAAVLLKPFYAEIIPSEMSRVCGWWWKGLPQKIGSTVIIGEPYSLMIPAVQKHERISDNMFYVDNASYFKIFSILDSKYFAVSIPRQEIQYGRQPYSSYDYDYANKFPFGR